MFNEYIADDIIVSLYKKKRKKPQLDRMRLHNLQYIIRMHKLKNQNENALPVAINCGA